MDLYAVRDAHTGAVVSWQGTQLDAKARVTGGANGALLYEAVDVPDRKAERLAWLNVYAVGYVAREARPTQTPAAIDESDYDRAPARHQAPDGDCPVCHRTSRGAAAIAAGQDVAAFVAWMLDAEAWQLSSVFAAIGERMAEVRA